MIILRSPKGWTGPKYVDGLKIEGTWRSHQVPFGDMDRPEHVRLLEEWMRSYRPQELFDGDGRLRPEIAALAPQGDRRMSANPHANGGLLRRDLVMANFADYAVEGTHPGRVDAEATRVMGVFLRDVMKQNRDFRLFGPDETAPNRLSAVFEATGRAWVAETSPDDDMISISRPTAESWKSSASIPARGGSKAIF
jgi:xylulose-5-phosphate/fructose-6-phosphate phosphoketolase